MGVSHSYHFGAECLDVGAGGTGLGNQKLLGLETRSGPPGTHYESVVGNTLCALKQGLVSMAKAPHPRHVIERRGCQRYRFEDGSDESPSRQQVGSCLLLASRVPLHPLAAGSAMA